MTQQNRVRTYLDPDAVGPLPRSSLADDSDQLSAARTILRVPQGSSTLELRPDDVIEIVDPNRKPTSLAPVGYDTAYVLPRRKLGRWVVLAMGVAIAVLAIAAVQGISRPESAAEHTSAAKPVAAAANAADTATLPPADTATLAPAAAAPLPAITPSPAATTGTLRVDTSAEGQRIFVDGIALSATAALLRCGPHDVAVGSAGRTRTIEVPCGGEVTLYR
jgi:hypothetical protein